MTINATAAILLALYIAVAKEQGVDVRKLSGTVQNDILKEYIARGTYIYPAAPLDAHHHRSLPLLRRRGAALEHHLISGYHIREAGSTAAQEIGFTLSNGIAYVRAAQDAGWMWIAFAGQLSFFFNGHNNFFEEVAKFRAARRMWARIMRERFGAKDPRSWMLRFHTQTAGSTLTAQQPENNIVRTAYQAMAAVLGGTQSLHTNSFDEALSLPTENAVRIALRTQQILAYETGVADTIDPLAGSYYVESLTDELERRAWEYIERIDALGGSVRAIEQGYIQREIEEAAYRLPERAGRPAQASSSASTLHQVESERRDRRSCAWTPSSVAARPPSSPTLRARRDNAAVGTALAALEDAARGSANLLPRILDRRRGLAPPSARSATPCAASSASSTPSAAM